MYYIGYLIYAVVIGAIVFLPAAKDLVVTAYALATEITVGCLVVAALPALQFGYYHARGFKGQFYYERLVSVSNTSGNTVVSLGLIGTFVGLTNMIAKIASAIGGEGGSMDEQIALIMSAIGESLDAMSFAFLTSVMGVAASVTIFCATVYFKMYFDKNDDADESNVTSDAVGARIDQLEVEQKKILGFVSKLTGASVDRQELSSIIVSNTLQAKSVTRLLGEFEKSVTSHVETNEGHSKAMAELTSAIKAMENCQMQQLQFMSALYKDVAVLKDNSGVAIAGAEKQRSKVDGILSGLKKSLEHI